MTTENQIRTPRSIYVFCLFLITILNQFSIAEQKGGPKIGITVRDLYRSGKIAQADGLVAKLFEEKMTTPLFFADFSKPDRKVENIERSVTAAYWLTWAMDVLTLEEAVKRFEIIREDSYFPDEQELFLEDSPHARVLYTSLAELYKYYSVSKQYRKADGIFRDLESLGFWETPNR